MKKQIKYGIAAMAALVFCFLYAHVDKAANIYDKKTDSSQYIAVQTDEDCRLSQTFVCSTDKLDGISVKIITYNAPESGSLGYRLKNSKGEELISGEIPLGKIKTGKFRKVKFDQPFTGTKDQIFTIEFFGKDLEETKGVGLYYNPGDPNGKALMLAGTKTDGTMILRTIEHGFDLETFIVMLGFVVYIVIFLRGLYRLFS